MVFCNKQPPVILQALATSHNPYFNRWFSAIKVIGYYNQYDDCHNPYFNRWFSAMKLMSNPKGRKTSQSLF